MRGQSLRPKRKTKRTHLSVLQERRERAHTGTQQMLTSLSFTLDNIDEGVERVTVRTFSTVSGTGYATPLRPRVRRVGGEGYTVCCRESRITSSRETKGSHANSPKTQGRLKQIASSTANVQHTVAKHILT